MNIDEMPAGRELDKLIAETVMGWTEVVYHRAPGAMLHGVPPVGTARRELRELVDTLGIKYRVPEYSNDIAAAFEVLKRVIADGGTPQLYFSSGEWWARLGGLNSAHGTPSAPLAICRAALLAYHHTIKERS